MIMASTDQKSFHICTPLHKSLALSKVAGTTVYIKLDNVQPTGSFKIRGVGYLCQKAAEENCKHFVCSSGGNAGLAAAFAAQKLQIPATILVPSSTPEFTIQKLKEYGALVEVVGKVWDDANKQALKLSENAGWVYVPPFDHPLIWEGHASIVMELRDALPCKPGAIILSVGGGGLFCGVVEGLKKVGWCDVPIIAMETKGANSLNEAVKAGKLVTLPDITSVAKSLGAKTVCEKALQNTQEHIVLSEVISDHEAVQATERFLDDERILVEPACGASLAAIYSGVIQRLQKEGQLVKDLQSIVVIVCGGSSITMAQLKEYKMQLVSDQ
ncbi:serine dehydratase-like isoform X1 [Pristis pectinata]|uniref:serine dehydratase-like isoform X1 n=2 Tax=Pristis pectinata TaxID=685728 RepID=UPI00223E3F18|nr:serine dehydratase-like isoform X1 [Pristis pectinata]